MVVNLVVMTRSVPKPSLSRGTMQIGMAATAPVLPMPLLQMAAIAPLRRHLLRTLDRLLRALALGVGLPKVTVSLAMSLLVA